MSEQFTPEQRAEAISKAEIILAGGDGTGHSYWILFRNAQLIARALLDLDLQCRDLRGVCAEAYQLAGAVGAPAKVLDNLSYAAQGAPLPHSSFLPILDTDCIVVAEQASKIVALESAEFPVNLRAEYSRTFTEQEKRIEEQQRLELCLEPGKASAIVMGMFDLAKQQCGYRPTAKHGLTYIKEELDRRASMKLPLGCGPERTAKLEPPKIGRVDITYYCTACSGHKTVKVRWRSHHALPVGWKCRDIYPTYELPRRTDHIFSCSPECRKVLDVKYPPPTKIHWFATS